MSEIKKLIDRHNAEYDKFINDQQEMNLMLHRMYAVDGQLPDDLFQALEKSYREEYKNLRDKQMKELEATPHWNDVANAMRNMDIMEQSADYEFKEMCRKSYESISESQEKMIEQMQRRQSY